MAQTHIHQLSTLRLDPDGPLRRDPPPKCKVLSKDFWHQYDAHTLIYDCWHDPVRGEVHVASPLPLNLTELLTQADVASGGDSLPFVRAQKGRHHLTRIYKAASPGPDLSVKAAGQQWTLPLHPVDDTLAGHRVLYTLSRNNDLRWIADWAGYHVREHGADAVLICDNGSDAYTLRELARTLGKVRGLRAALIISAPLPYGPARATCTDVSAAEYLQTSLMNICAARFLSAAKSVLTIDVDELVVSPDGQSIFQAVETSAAGFITFPGTWRYAQGRAVHHVDHIYMRPGDTPCPTKYAVRPGAWLAKRPWQVHSLAGINRTLFRRSKRFGFWHCRNISTSWKNERSAAPRDKLVVDNATKQRLLKAFAEPE